ncbi:hypothetical protein [Rhizobacter sp. SG703]|uniref:hypothetical protein n=1 Tax=Rhizobacter sp. SG703 TaxID=2587140 RepID=UPI0014456CF7|nr:hypothetical protein [Rhizobacter sp. SG703]NKI94547.1 hypothetical protein [Rhizobacter sp. SG703]
MSLFRSAFVLAASAAVAVFVSGCSTTAPTFQPSIANVSTLKAAGSTPVAVGAFTVQAGLKTATSIQLRAADMTTDKGSYAQYLADALKSELDLAKRLDPKATIEITGVLLKNDIAAGGFSTNSGEVEARFIVRRDGQVKYEKTKRGTAEWEGSFAGATAIPKAAQQYPVLVQNMLAALYADADFVAAIR